MAKVIVIEHCGQCPDSQFDPHFPSEQWGKWACRNSAIETKDDEDNLIGILLHDLDGPVQPIPEWCPLKDA